MASYHGKRSQDLQPVGRSAQGKSIVDDDVECVFGFGNQCPKMKLKEIPEHLKKCHGDNPHYCNNRKARKLILKLSEYIIKKEVSDKTPDKEKDAMTGFNLQANRTLSDASRQQSENWESDMNLERLKKDLESKISEEHSRTRAAIESCSGKVTNDDSQSGNSHSSWTQMFSFKSSGSKEKPEQLLLQQQKDIQSLTDENSKQRQELEDANEEIRSLRKTLNEVQRRRLGHQVVGGVEHGQLIALYDDLFSNDFGKAFSYMTQHRVDSRSAMRLLGYIFEISYSTFKDHIMNTLFDDVFTHNFSGDKNLKAVKAKADAYGDLIHQFILGDLQHHTVKVEEKLIQHIQLDAALRQFSFLTSGRENEVTYFLKKAIALSQKMLTIDPPIQLSFPATFHERIQERHGTFWDERLGEKRKYHLEYFRPVVYTSYEEEFPVRKGQVGNYKLK